MHLDYAEFTLPFFDTERTQKDYESVLQFRRRRCSAASVGAPRRVVKHPYVPQGRLEPSAVGVEKLDFVLSDNGMIIWKLLFLCLCFL